ncbi:MAG: GGDEF domain-containing protein [Candidatus Omnitrophica bacterium]|nr:GGDEF domain-containing protein [Candidatus Omnitrophota bacterium]
MKQQAHPIRLFVDNIKSGLMFLRFAPESEKAFLHYYHKRTIGQTRASIILAILLYESVAFIDPYVVPGVLSQVRMLRFLIVLPAFLLTFFMTYIFKRDTVTQIFVCAGVTIGGFCVGAMMFIDPGLGSQIYHSGLILTIIYGYTFMRLRFGYAVASGLFIAVFYIMTAALIRKTSFPVLINNALFSVIANFIGIFVAYTLELNMRSEYLNAMAMKRTHKGLQKLSLFDELTGVANRRLFDIKLSSEFQQMYEARKPLSLIIMDVDWFKAYNDSFGHFIGDECLIKIAKKLQQCATRTGDLAARYGGEEFAIILADTPLDGAHIVAEKMRREIKELKIPHPSLPGGVVTISLGVASAVPSRGNSAEELVKAADRALYKAKENGRDRVEVFKE